LKEGNQSGFGSGWAHASLRATSNLPTGVYTALFEIFTAIVDSDTVFLNREPLIQQTDDNDNYKIITFSHDYQTTHSKAFIQFTSNGQPGEISFQFRVIGSEYTNPNLNFLFYCRTVSGKVGYAFDHAIFNVDSVQLNDQILYFKDINLNGNILRNIEHAIDDSNAVNLQQLGDSYRPYLYESTNFHFYVINNKINPTNVHLASWIP